MSDLTAKFDELQAQLATQHTELIEAINGINIMIPIPPDYTVQLGGILGQLESTHAAIVGDGFGGTSVYTYLEQIGINTDLASDRAESILTYLGNNWAVFEAIYDAIGGQPPSSEFTLRALLQHISARTGGIWESTGVLANPAAGTMLAFLACICNATTEVLPANPIDADNPLSCVEPYTSDEMVYLPAGIFPGSPNLMYARFSTPPPDGIIYGTVFGLGADEVALYSDDWSGWSVFVESDQPQYAEFNGDLMRYPTNQWRALSGAGEKQFSIDARGSIKVYLCSDAEVVEIPEGECITIPMYKTSFQNAWAWDIVRYPAHYTIHGTVDFAWYDGEEWAGGPISAGIPIAFSDVPFVQRLVGGIDFPSAPSVVICNPEQV